MAQVIVLREAQPRRAWGVRNALVWLAIGASIFALWMLNEGDYRVPLIGAGVAAVGLAVTAIPYTRQHREWLVFVLGLTYLVISISLLSEQERAILHYGVLLAFCLPIIAVPYDAGLLWEGDFKLYCYYFAWALATTSYSLAPAFSAGRWIGAVLGFCAVLACVAEVREARDCERLFWRFLIACAIVIAATLIAAVVLPTSITWQTPADGLDPAALMRMREQGIQLTGMDRFRGIFGNANDVGALMLITVSSALACWKNAPGRRRIFIGLVIALAIALAIWADSRSPFVGLIVGAGLYVLWRYRLRGALAIGIVAIAALGVLTAFGQLDSYVTRGNVDTLTGRNDMWAYVVEKIRERPLSGYGYEVSGAIFNNRYFPLWFGPWDEGPHSSLHNGYLTHAIGVGVPATLLWCFIVIRPWIFAFRQKHDPWNLKTMGFLMVVPMLVYNLTEAAIGDFMNPVGFLFGLSWAVAERYRTLELERQRREQANALEALPPAVRALRDA